MELHCRRRVSVAADLTRGRPGGCSALQLLNDRVMALQQLPSEQLEPAVAQQLQQRLQALKQKRQELDSMADQLAQLQRQADSEEPPPPEQGQSRSRRMVSVCVCSRWTESLAAHVELQPCPLVFDGALNIILVCFVRE